MDCGLFEGSFYIVQEPTYINKLNVHLNTIQTNLVHRIVSSERIKRIHIEFGTIGDGIIWHKDHFELVLLFTTVLIINSFTHVIIFSSI